MCQLSAEVCKFGLLNFKYNRRQDVVPREYIVVRIDTNIFKQTSSIRLKLTMRE